MTNTAAAQFTTKRVEVSTIIVAIYRVTNNYPAATEAFVNAATELGYEYGTHTMFTNKRANAIYSQAVQAA